MADKFMQGNLVSVFKMGRIIPTNPYMNLHLVDLFDTSMTFRIRKMTKMETVINAYYQRRDIVFGRLCFFYSGRLLSGEDTPESLNMQDGDTIRVIPALTAN